MQIMTNKLLLSIACVVATLVVVDVRSDVFINEVRSLSRLPMEKLIHIKSAFSDQPETLKSTEPLDTDFEESSPTLPVALSLKRAKSNPVRRHDDYWHDEKSKSSKISKIFQLAITALSFFAFGGYLLTLIITAIRRNAAAAATGNVIFLQGLQSVKRPRRSAIFHNPMENDFNTDRLYRGMIMLSEGYALYH